MRTQYKITIIMTIFGMMLSACGTRVPEPTVTPTNTAEPSSTPQPTDTPEPTPTFTVTPTNTPEPTSTATPTPEPIIELGEVQDVPVGGFSFKPVIGYQTEIDGPGVLVADDEGDIFLGLFGERAFDSSETPEGVIDGFLDNLEEGWSAEIEQGEVYSVVVNGTEGIAYDLDGKIGSDPFAGKIVLVFPAESQYLLGIGIAEITTDTDKWIAEGSKVFEAMLDSVVFIEEQEFSGSACPVSSDSTYGFSKDNPIKVGGDWLEGPARERAYLDSLSGPDGEVVSYERLRSVEHGDTILDEYEVQYNGVSVVLFLDEYNYDDLAAPAGLACWMPIPLSAP